MPGEFSPSVSEAHTDTANDLVDADNDETAVITVNYLSNLEVNWYEHKHFWMRYLYKCKTWQKQEMLTFNKLQSFSSVWFSDFKNSVVHSFEKKMFLTLYRKLKWSDLQKHLLYVIWTHAFFTEKLGFSAALTFHYIWTMKLKKRVGQKQCERPTLTVVACLQFLLPRAA